MSKVKPLLELSEKEFLRFFKLGIRTGGQLSYRIKWLIKTSDKIGLSVLFEKRLGKYIVGIHCKYLEGRQIQNPFYSENSFIEGVNCLYDKDKYNEDDSFDNNLERLKNNKGYVYYYFKSEIKTFIFSLIKKYYNDNK